EERNQRRRRFHELLQRALGAFQKVEAVLLERRKSQRLSDEAEAMLRQTSFSVADCQFHLAKPLSPHPKLDHWKLANQAVDDLYVALEKMPESAFDGSSEIHRRRFW